MLLASGFVWGRRKLFAVVADDFFHLPLLVCPSFVIQVFALACGVVAGDPNSVIQGALVAPGAGAVVRTVAGGFLFFGFLRSLLFFFSLLALGFEFRVYRFAVGLGGAVGLIGR